MSSEDTKTAPKRTDYGSFADSLGVMQLRWHTVVDALDDALPGWEALDSSHLSRCPTTAHVRHAIAELGRRARGYEKVVGTQKLRVVYHPHLGVPYVCKQLGNLSLQGDALVVHVERDPAFVQTTDGVPGTAESERSSAVDKFGTPNLYAVRWMRVVRALDGNVPGWRLNNTNGSPSHKYMGDSAVRTLKDLAQSPRRGPQVPPKYWHWEHSYTSKVVERLTHLDEMLKIGGMAEKTEIRSALQDACNLLRDYHSSAHEVYEQRDAAREGADNLRKRVETLETEKTDLTFRLRQYERTCEGLNRDLANAVILVNKRLAEANCANAAREYLEARLSCIRDAVRAANTIAQE